MTKGGNMGMLVMFGAASTLLSLVLSYSASDEANLRAKLFEGYNPKLLPTWNHSVTTVVSFAFTLQALRDLDEKEQVLSLMGNLQLFWKNEMLQWNTSDHRGIKFIHLGKNDVWTPNLAIGNSVSSDSFIGSRDFLVRLQHDGRTSWYPDSVTKTKCLVEVTQYPFDTQICLITWVVQRYPKERMVLNASRSTVALHLFKENGEWDITGHRVFSDSERNQKGLVFSKIVCELTLKRRVAYHVINTLLPVLILSILNVLVFVLPPEAGEKMSLSITVLLAYALFLSLINENMPGTSTSVSALAVYMVFTLALGTMSTLLSAIVLHYAYGHDDGSQRFLAPCCFQCNKVSRKRRSTCADEADPSRGELQQEAPISSLNTGNPLVTNFKNRSLVRRIDISSFWTLLAFVLLLAIICITMMNV